MPGIFAHTFDLKQLYPHRTRFHISEFTGFAWAMCRYFCAIGERETAALYYQMLKHVALRHPITKHAKRPLALITTVHKVGQNHRLKNRPGCHLGALVPCCRGKNDNKMVWGAKLGMARPPAWQLSARAGVRLTCCDSCFLPASRPPSCARADRRSPWPRGSSQRPVPSQPRASWW